ncbi:LysE family translocator [Rhizobium sp. RAF56]|uniref:LysE family translocator n=1 Tax=Rhizobium sp. RAF56 TaxID=3233062 RepID=UPI003F957E0C
MGGEFSVGSGLLWPSLALALKSALVMGSPGPATMSATAVGAAYGVRRSLPYVGGLIAGTVAVLLVVATGVFAILLSMPLLNSVLEAGSVLYILYLAYRIATAPPLSASEAKGVRPSFSAGLLLALANPKAYIAIAAVFTGAARGLPSSAMDVLVRLAVLGIMIVLIHLLWLFAGSSLSRLFQSPASARVINLTFAALLVGATLLPML